MFLVVAVCYGDKKHREKKTTGKLLATHDIKGCFSKKKEAKKIGRGIRNSCTLPGQTGNAFV